MKNSDEKMNPLEPSYDSFDLDEEFHVDFGDDFDSIMDDALNEDSANSSNIEGNNLDDFEFDEDDYDDFEDSEDYSDDEEYEYVNGKRPTKFDKGLNIALSVGGSVIGILAIVLILVVWNGFRGDEVKVTKSTSQKEGSTEKEESKSKEIITMFEEPDATTDTEISTFYVQQMSSEEEQSRWQATQTENTDSSESTPEESASKDDTPEETTLEDNTLEETTTKKPKETTTEPDTTEATTPEETTPEATTPEATTPEPDTTEATTPEPATPDDTQEAGETVE